MYIRVVLVLVVAVLVASPTAGAQVPGVPHQPSENEEQVSDDFRYSDLLSAIERGSVREALLDPRRAEVSVRLAGGREETLGYPPDQNLADRLARAGARVEVAPGDDGSGPGFFGFAVLGMIALTLVLFALSLRSRRSQAHGPGGAGGPLRAGTKVSEATRPTVTFRDVAGCDEAVEEVAEFVEFLKDPDRFARVGARMPRGRAAARAAGHRQDAARQGARRRGGGRFFAASGAEFVERYVGVGASRVRELFTAARDARAARSSSSTSSTRGPPAQRRRSGRQRRVRAHAQPAPHRDGRLHRQRAARRASAPPTGSTCSIRPCCGPAASRARSRSSSRVPRAGSRSCRCTPADAPSPARSTWPRSPRAPEARRAPTCARC